MPLCGARGRGRLRAVLLAWLQAARPLSQANIAVPLLYGQALAFGLFQTFSWRRFALAMVYGVLTQLFIVFANDAADWEADLKNLAPTPFSGGSRVVPEGKLSPMALGKGALVLAALLGAFGFYVTLQERLALALLFCTAPLLLTWAYSFKPLRLSYRGGGEHLQALGVGAVLPVVGLYFQAGTLAALPWGALIPCYLLGWAGNVVTALPDEPADRRSDKRARPVVVGAARARLEALLAVGLALALTPLATPGVLGITRAVAVAPAASLLVVAALWPKAQSVGFVVAAGGAIMLGFFGWAGACWVR